MKLFKKLAAAALAAVLALSMVGCGAGGTGSAFDMKNEVLNSIEEVYHANDKDAKHTTAMDTAAAKLIDDAAKAGEKEGNKDDTVKALLEKQTIEGEGGYIAIFVPYTQWRTEYMQRSYIMNMIGALNWATSSNPYPSSDYEKMVAKIGKPVFSRNDPIEMGAATGTIKGKNYLVLLVKKAVA